MKLQPAALGTVLHRTSYHLTVRICNEITTDCALFTEFIFTVSGLAATNYTDVSCVVLPVAQNANFVAFSVCHYLLRCLSLDISIFLSGAMYEFQSICPLFTLRCKL